MVQQHSKAPDRQHGLQNPIPMLRDGGGQKIRSAGLLARRSLFLVMRLLAVLVVLTATLPIGTTRTTEAASALAVQLDGSAYAFRYVLGSSSDFVVLIRYRLVPLSQDNYQDTASSVTVDGSGNADLFRVTNRVYQNSYTVQADGTTDVTSKCTILSDYVTVKCTSTGLGAGSHSFQTTYRSGWSAYDSPDVLFRLLDSSTIKKERNVPSMGYRLVAFYLNASQWTSSGMTWGAGTVTVKLQASPTLWISPSSSTATVIWDTAANNTETKNNLQTRLRAMLLAIEQDDPTVAQGALVQATGITNAGATIAQDAFAQITQAIPSAFQTANYNTFPSLTPAPQAYATQIESDAASSGLGDAWSGIGNQFGGINGKAIGMLAFGLAAVGLALFVLSWTSTGPGPAVGLAMMTAWSVLVFGWMLNAVPGIAVALPAALLGAAGLIWLIGRKVLQG